MPTHPTKRDAGGAAGPNDGVEDEDAASDMDAGPSEVDGIDAAAASSDAADDASSDAGEAGDATDAGIPADASVDAALPCRSEQPSDSGVPGVTIQIESDRCTFPYGQGGTFRYRVTLDQALPYSVAAGTSCGFCGKFGSDAESLVLPTVVASNNASYCPTCDVGCCPPNVAGSYVLGAQSLTGMLAWPARSWSGPSDTSAPLGDFFPRGPGAVLVTLNLPDGRSAFAKLPITIE